MTHDFARQRAARNSRERKGSPFPWMSFLSGLVLGVLLSFLVYLATLAPGPARPAVASAPVPAPAEAAPAPATPQHKPEFSFYSDLPKITVDKPARSEPVTSEKPPAAAPPKAPPPETAKADPSLTPTPAPVTRPTPAKAPVDVPEPGALTLQAGAFRDAADANRRRADITLMGYPSRVVTVAGAAEGARYRVQVGPFADEAALSDARGALKDQGIDVR